MSSLRSFFSDSLSSFAAASDSTFRILHTHPPVRLPPPSHLQIHTLLVLDSSFNPPTRAHLSIARSALLSSVSSATHHKSPPSDSPPTNNHTTRLLFLLATQNADKAPKPASFADRLVLMTLMARSLLASLPSSSSEGLLIDIGVTKKPYFVDKAASIDDSHVYTEAGSGKTVVEQVHLTGFDTLTRIFDKKYYGEEGLEALRPFLEKHRVWAVCREESKEGSWGTMEEQRRWVEKLGKGEVEGVDREWVKRVELVEGEEEAEGVSSTKVREGCKRGDWSLVEELVGKEEMEYIREQGLYQEEDEG